MNRILIILSLLIYNLGALSQEDSPSKNIFNVINNVYKFNRNYPQEKVYLHFDNTGYFQGETIWYKAYVTQNSAGLTTKTPAKGSYVPTKISRVLYVEFISPGGDVLETQKMKIDDNGQANGQFKLDSLYVTGFYEIRAYTRYMTNWGANAMFSRVFPIFEKPKQYGDWSKPTISQVLYKDRNPNSRVADSLYLTAAAEGIYTNDSPSKISAQFYPEGGDLVQGLKSRVAFVVIDDNGSAYKGKGKIVDASGKNICTVETDSTGRGLFEITPTGEKLWLSMLNPKKKEQRFELPMVKAEGTTLYLDVISDDITAKIYSNLDIQTEDDKNYILGYSLMNSGNVYACDTMTYSPSIELTLLRETMPEGVNQITVFNSEGRILAERLFFICPKPNKEDSITITPISPALGPTSVVELKVHAQPHSTFSFSALDYNTMTGWKSGNAKTWMLLSSDVKGYIADIDYYFEADDKEHRESADLLMLIQGWRRYDWKLMSGQEWFKNIQPIEDSLYVFGQLKEYRKRNPINNVAVDVYLYNRQGQSMSGHTRTDSLGNYAFKLPDVTDDWEMHMFTRRDDKRKTYYVGIDRQFAPLPRFITPDETHVIQKGPANLFAQSTANGTQADDDIKYAEKVHVIPQVTVKARKYWTSSDNISWYNQKNAQLWATVFYNGPAELDKILDRGKPMPTVFEFLAMKNPLFGNPPANTLPQRVYLDPEAFINGMTYGGRSIRWIVDNGLAEYVSGRSSFVQSSSDPTAASFQGIVGFPLYMDEVKAIYIAPYNPREEESCVRIYIYRRILFSSESQKGLRRTHYQGYNVPETFHQEDYNVLPPLENLRRTLYWEPNVKTDEQGNATIQFYNNLSAKQIYVTAEGITKDGTIMVNE